MFTRAVGITASDWSVSDVIKIRQILAFPIFYKNCRLILRLNAKCLLKIARLIVEYTLNLNSCNFLAQTLGYKSNPYLADLASFQKKKIRRNRTATGGLEVKNLNWQTKKKTFLSVIYFNTGASLIWETGLFTCSWNISRHSANPTLKTDHMQTSSCPYHYRRQKVFFDIVRRCWCLFLRDLVNPSNLGCLKRKH